MATIPELQQAIAAAPENWELRFELVRELVLLGRHESAVEVVNQGEALPREAPPWLAAARCYGAVGALEQAAGLVATALEIDPGYGPALAYQAELQASFAEMQGAAPEGEAPIALTAEDVEDLEEAPSGEAPGSPEASGAEAAPVLAAAPVPLDAAGDGPVELPRVSFSNHEMEALKAAEEEARRRMEAAIRRDKTNSLVITLLLHVGIVVLLMLVATQVPPNVPPQIVASSPAEQPEDQIVDTVLEKPTVDPTTAVNTANVDIVTVSAESSFSLSNLDVPMADTAMDQVVSLSPSMSLGMPASSESRMMFGQPMEGNVLGVIMDVSGSMGEFLPAVVREVDRNFTDSPIVYIRNILVRSDRDDGSIRLIVPEEVRSHHPVQNPRTPICGTRTPYWFLWHDLPRRTPQRYVDRIIDTYKSRDNQFLVGGSNSPVVAAIRFLMEENVDSLYIFSDFEDLVDDDVARSIGQMLGRRKIRTYVQPAYARTEHLDTLTKRVANRTFGRELPPLISLLRGEYGQEEEPDSLLPQAPTEEKPEVDFDFTYATPRPDITGEEWFAFRPGSGWYELGRISEPEYDAVFYGPEARVRIFLKDDDGQYIQRPFNFGYHSHKQVLDERFSTPRWVTRSRRFLGVEETPSFDGKEIVWKMLLEDDLKFHVHLYIGRKGMNATYVADPPNDGRGDGAYIAFSTPRLAQERNDRYYGHDFPAEGVLIDDVREVVRPNQVIFNLPRQDRDRYARRWRDLLFEPGYNTIAYDHGMRRPPPGIRDLVVQGPSFGPRKFRARTTSSRILLTGGSALPDIEPWEAFSARLYRPSNRRTRFTKTEAIEIEIE